MIKKNLMTKVTVIIPMYKVSAFIEKCAMSLMRQTFEDVEFLFVDDCSPDDSRAKLEEVLAKYPGRNARILTHDHNQGLPAARNTGLREARGRYIVHCDGDDWMEPDMLEKLYKTASTWDADYVWCDFYISFEQNERYMMARDYRTAEQLIRKGFLSGDMKFNVWNKMVRRDVYEKTAAALGQNTIDIFPAGHSMAEDMTMIMLAAHSVKVAYVPSALYHYVKTNSEAYTQNMSQRNLDDIRYNVDRTVTFLKNCRGTLFDKEIDLFKLNVKLPFLLSGDESQCELWKQWYPEANGAAFSNKELPFRTKFLQWMAARNQWWYVRAYYKLVYKFIYGVVYK